MNFMNHLSWAINLAQEGKKMLRLTNTKWAKGNQLNRGQGGCTRCPRQEFVPQPSFPSSHDPFDNWSVLSWSFFSQVPQLPWMSFPGTSGSGNLPRSFLVHGRSFYCDSVTNAVPCHYLLFFFKGLICFFMAVVEPDYACLAMSLIWWFTGCALVSIKKLGLGCLDRKVGRTHQ